MRQGDWGACGVFFDGSQLKIMDAKVHELVFVCRGPQVTASLNGKAIPLYDNTSTRSVCLQFNATSGSLRITAIDYRAAP